MSIEDITSNKIPWSFFLKPIIFLLKKLINFFTKNETVFNGIVSISKVNNQGIIFSCFQDYIKHTLSIKDIPRYLSQLAYSTIDNQYIINMDNVKDDKLKEYNNKIKVLINNTRISTFLVFTDGENILLINRKKSDKHFLNIQNNRYDVFGSVNFDNSSIFIKIGNQTFFDSKIKKISCIPGFAFEDTREPKDNPFTRQTVIMIGLVIYISNKDLKLAESSRNTIIESYSIEYTPNDNKLTSKAKLGIDYLLAHK